MTPIISTRMKRALWAAAAGLSVASAAQAQELIVNGSFEDNNSTFIDSGNGFMTVPNTSDLIAGWETLSFNPISWGRNGNSFGIATPAGSYFLDLTGPQDNSEIGGLFQTIHTVRGQAYYYSMSLGSCEDNALFSGYKSVFAYAAGAGVTFNFNPTGTGNQWERFEMTFVAEDDLTTIGFYGTGDGGGGGYLGVDDVSVTAVPEPAIYGAASAGILAAFGAVCRLRWTVR